MMGFKCGIIGLPNVGKSTIFNALTQASVAALNYPFCTIEPNIGIVPVPDQRLFAIAKIVNPKKITPAIVEFVDIAGIVKNASQGEGLGNQFLAHIREVQAIAHVVRCFTNKDVAHVTGTVDPVADVEIINTELILSDLNTIEKALIKNSKNLKSGDKKIIKEKQILEKIKKHLNSGQTARTFFDDGNSDKQLSEEIKKLYLLTAKPVLYLANIDEKSFFKNKYLDQLNDIAQKEAAEVLPICAALESEIVKLNEADKKIFLANLGVQEPGLNRFIRAGYRLLSLQTFFTTGPKEVRAWTVKKNATAQQAAGVIHSDFQHGFIRAEVIAYDDFIKYCGEQKAKEAGKLRLEGKNYIVQDGDIIYFRFNV